MMKNAFDATVEIVTAMLSSSTVPVCKEGGEDVASFIQEIYKKLHEIEQEIFRPKD